jgi:AraC-like DNA-binding protein
MCSSAGGPERAYFETAVANGRPPDMKDTRPELLERLPQGAATRDALTDALDGVALRSWIPGRLELTAPWGIHVATHWGWFYLVARNGCVVEVDGHDAPLSAGPGDLIIVSQGRGHRLRDTAGSPVTPIQDLLDRGRSGRPGPHVHGGGGAATRLFCGCFLLDALEQSTWHTALPAVMHVKGERQQAWPYVDHVVRLLEAEVATEEPAGQSIINCLVRVLFMKTLQSCWPERSAGPTRWLRALADPDIGRAIGLMHSEPGAPWTVAALADRVAMARSTFAARFTELMGQPPLEYLTQWRIQKACFLLRTTRAELKKVAAQVGYESTSAFCMAFALWVGTAPGAYRRARDAAPASPSVCMPPLWSGGRRTATSAVS